MKTEEKRLFLRTALLLVLIYDFKEEPLSHNQKTVFYASLHEYRYHLPEKEVITETEGEVTLLNSRYLKDIVNSFFGGERFREAVLNNGLVEIQRRIRKLTKCSEGTISDWLKTELIQSEK